MMAGNLVFIMPLKCLFQPSICIKHVFILVKEGFLRLDMKKVKEILILQYLFIHTAKCAKMIWKPLYEANQGSFEQTFYNCENGCYALCILVNLFAFQISALHHSRSPCNRDTKYLQNNCFIDCFMQRLAQENITCRLPYMGKLKSNLPSKYDYAITSYF